MARRTQKSVVLSLRHRKRLADDAASGAAFAVPPSDAGPKRVFVSCHFCGYSPAVVPAEGACPKCGKRSWERYALSTRLLPQKANN